MTTEPESPPADPPVRRLPYATASGALLAAAPIPWAAAAWAHGGVGTATPVWALVVLAAAVTALLVAGFAISRQPRAGRLLATLGVAAPVALASPRLLDSPGLTLLFVAASMLGLGVVWRVGAPLFHPGVQRSRPGLGRVRGSAAIALVFWLFVGLGGQHATAQVAAAVGVSMLVALAAGAVWLLRWRRHPSARTRTLTVGFVAAVALAAAAHDELWSLVSCGVVYVLVAVVFGPREERAADTSGSFWATMLEHPARLLVVTFATMAAVGAVVLALPQSSTAPAGVSGLDAVFTAVSAVCVTGLVVRDTGADFTALGQVTILVLIQLGALGIMTFSAAALRVLGARWSMRQESAAARVIGAKDRSTLVASAQGVLRVTFVAEGVGAVVLAALFLAHGDGLGTACWRGCFTAVSAFCNAGFALQADSLVGYRDAPLVLHVVAALIVLGGLSPVVVLAIATRRGRAARMSLQIRLCLWSAAVLAVLGFGFFLAVEWDGVLAGLSPDDKLHNAWFQSVTLRTAGFNTVDVAAVQPATWMLMLAMMFVGGSPGGTAGGIKTTTAAVLLLAVAHAIRGSAGVTAFGRRLPDATVRRASVIVTVAALGAVLGVVALLLTQRIPLPAVVFEAVSALGTVGLSQGATTELDEVGRVVVVACMFIGRIGGLTIMMFMSRHVAVDRVVHPDEDVDVG